VGLDGANGVGLCCYQIALCKALPQAQMAEADAALLPWRLKDI
jgi:hypothetical protein